MLETEISKSGEVLVEGHLLGRLEGFRFVADPQAGGSEAKALRAAAQKALAGEIAARSARLAAAPDEQFVIASDGAIRWLGDVVGKLAPGDSVLKPQIRLIADEHLTGPSREAVQARLDLWIGAHIEKVLGPLVALAKAEDITGIGRGIAFQLVEALGVLERQKVAEDIKTLDQAGRAALRKYSVRFGAYHIYVPQLLKPAPRVLALQLWALKQPDPEIKGIDELPPLAASGRTSLPVDKQVSKALYRTIGYRVCGERAVRVDILERLADIIRPALAWRPNSPGIKPPGAVDGSSFMVTGAMTSLVGSAGEDFASVLRALGYRMDRRPKPPEPEPQALPPAEPSAEVAAEAEAGAAESASAIVDAESEAVIEATPVDSVDALATETEAPPAPADAETDADRPETAEAETGAAAAVDEAQPVIDAAAESPAEPAASDSEPSPAASTEDQTQSAETSPAADANAEPEMIEVWRPGRFEERRPPRRAAGAPHGKQRGAGPRRDQRQATGIAATPDGVAASQPAQPELAAAGRPEREDRRRPDDRRGPPRRGDRNEERSRQPRGQGKGGQGKGGQGKDRERREFQQYAPRERRNAEPDPNSPFAKLLALKEQLEGNSKERR